MTTLPEITAPSRDRHTGKPTTKAARRAAYRDPQISPCAKAVLAYLGTHPAGHGGWTPCYRSKIARGIGRRSRTVDRALAELVAHGYLDRLTPRRKRNPQGQIRCAGPAAYRVIPRAKSLRYQQHHRRAIGGAHPPLKGGGSASPPPQRTPDGVPLWQYDLLHPCDHGASSRLRDSGQPVCPLCRRSNDLRQ